jgi:hypothetical protein
MIVDELGREVRQEIRTDGESTVELKRSKRGFGPIGRLQIRDIGQ